MNYYDYLNAKLPIIQNMKDSAYKIDEKAVTSGTESSIFTDKKDIVKYNDDPIFAFAKKDDLKDIDYEKLLENDPAKIEDKKFSPLEIVMKEFLSIDKVKDAVDTDKNGEMSVDEVKDYFNKLLEKDGNGEELSLEDFEKALQELNVNLEEIFEKFAKEVEDKENISTPDKTEVTPSQTEEQPATVSEETPYSEPVQDYAPVSSAAPAASYSPAASSAPVSGGAPVQDSVPVQTESLEQLEAQKVEKEKVVTEKQADVSAVHSGKNENIKAAKDEETKAKEAYDKALKSDEAAKPFLKDIEKNDKALTKNEENISKNAQKISETESKISQAEMSLSTAEGDLASLEQQLNSLPALKGDDSDKSVKAKKDELTKQVSAKKKEVDKQKKELDKLKKELDKLNKEKEKLEEEKTKLEETKTKLDEKVKEVCSEDTKAKLEAYNTARSKTQEVKKTELDKANTALKTAQDELKTIVAKIAEVKAKQVSSSDKAEQAAQIAEQELAKGVREDNGNNDSVDIRRYKKGAKNSNQWCGYFTSYCFGDGQGSDNRETFGYTGSSQEIKRKAINAGHYAKKNSGYTPKRGDVAMWTKTASTGHVGIVTQVYADGSFDTIEGNSKNAVTKHHYKSQSSVSGTFDGFVKMNEWLG